MGRLIWHGMLMKYPKDEDLTEEQVKLLERLVNEKHTYLGLRRMFDVVKAECEQSNVKHIYRDQLERWLKDQEWYQLHKQPPKRKDTRQVSSQMKKPLDMVQADLVVFGDQHLDKSKSYRYPYKYILNIVDVYSRFLWSRALKKNDSETVAEAIIDIFDNEMPRRPSAMQVDGGAEFTDNIPAVRKIVGKGGNPYGQAIVERVNGTLKGSLFKYMSATGKTNWSQVLAQQVETYNNVRHSSLGGLTPKQVFNGEKIPEKQAEINKTQETKESDEPMAKGTKVRLRASEKGAGLTKGQPTYSRDIFTVESSTKPKGTQLRGYKVKDDEGTVKRGVYNKTELQVIQKVAPKPTEIKSASVEPVPDLRRSARLNEKRAILPRMD